MTLRALKTIVGGLAITAVALSLSSFIFAASKLQTHCLEHEHYPSEPFKLRSLSGETPYIYHLYGVVPTCHQKPDLVKQLVAQVSTSILFRFSPLVNDHVKTMFASHVTHEPLLDVYPMQVSCLPSRNNRFFCVLRVWFRLIRFSTFTNRYQDSVFYALELDNKLRYIPNSGHLINIPTAIQDTYWTGPEDPRIIMVGESLFVNLINGHAYPNETGTMRRQFLWSVEKSNLHTLEIPGHKLNKHEKNWSPWVVDNQLRFIYQIMPITRIIQCPLLIEAAGQNDRLDGCTFIVGDSSNPFLVNTTNLLVRGGSPFVRYIGDYYIAITHSVQNIENDKKGQITLFNGVTNRVVFISSPILIDPAVMKTLQLTDPVIVKPFFYARSIFMQDEDELFVAGGINDNQSFIVRISGVVDLLHEAIENDKKHACHTIFGKELVQVYSAMEGWLRTKNIQQLTSY